jgi:hypothetical protein
MSTQEEQIKAAIVICGDLIAIVDPGLNEATELVCRNLHQFVDYILTLDSELERHEAIVMVAAILKSLPAWFEENPDIVTGIKTECQVLRSNRQWSTKSE